MLLIALFLSNNFYKVNKYNNLSAIKNLQLYNSDNSSLAKWRAEVQNSKVVFQLDINNKTSFCASISRPNAKYQNVVHNYSSRKIEHYLWKRTFAQMIQK
jgi:hypothetical protein